MVKIEVKIILKTGQVLIPHINNLEMSFVRNKTAGMMKFKYKHNGIRIDNGDNVNLIVDNEPIFYGYIFNIMESKGFLTVTCFDMLRYLLFKDNRTYNNMPLSNAIRGILQEKGINSYEVDESGIYIENDIFRNNTYLDMIGYWVKHIKDVTGEDYTLYTKWTKVYFKNKKNCMVGTRLMCTTNIIDYNFTCDINEDTYNYFKIVRENRTKGIEDIYIRVNDSYQKKYGTLQYFKRVSDNITSGQVMQMLDILERQKVGHKFKLQLKAIGCKEFFIGALVKVYIEKVGINSVFMIEELKHIFRNELFTTHMTLTLVPDVH